jgi:hypothetical protein
MNGKKLVCIILIMVIAAVAYGTQLMSQRAHAMREEADAAESEAHTAESEAIIAKSNLVRLRDDTQDLRQFLKEWEPAVQRIQTQQEAEQAVLSLVRNSGILTVSQRFDLKQTAYNPLIPRVLQGTLTVQDEYSKTLNWLGELERKIPLARITTCRFKQGETGRQLNLELHIDIPLVALDAALEGDTATK